MTTHSLLSPAPHRTDRALARTAGEFCSSVKVRRGEKDLRAARLRSARPRWSLPETGSAHSVRVRAVDRSPSPAPLRGRVETLIAFSPALPLAARSVRLGSPER